MSKTYVEDYANFLHQHRINHSSIPDADLEKSIIDKSHAYAVQNALVEKLQTHNDAIPIGWKVGCTSKMTQEMSSTDEPFFGRMFKKTTFSQVDTIDLSGFFNPILEPEVGFLMVEDLRPNDAPFSEQDILKATGGLIPAVEIVDCRYSSGWPLKILRTIADNGVHGAFVKGTLRNDWQHIERAAISLKVELNGRFETDGLGANALGDPIQSVRWLANTCIKYGLNIKAGDFISAGNIANKAVFIKEGDDVSIDFSSLGKLDIRFT